MSNLYAKNPFSAWGYGERHRCDHCGQYEGNRPAHKPNCEWAKKDLARRKTAARRLLGLTKKDVAEALARKAARGVNPPRFDTRTRFDLPWEVEG